MLLPLSVVDKRLVVDELKDVFIVVVAIDTHDVKFIVAHYVQL